MRYFVEGKEITAQEAHEIESKNRQIIENGDFEQMANIKFIVVI